MSIAVEFLLRAIAARLGAGLLKFHQDESGDIIETILKIAIIALPLLLVLYALICALCGYIDEVLSKYMNVSDSGVGFKDTVGNICFFGCD